MEKGNKVVSLEDRMVRLIQFCNENRQCVSVLLVSLISEAPTKLTWHDLRLLLM